MGAGILGPRAGPRGASTMTNSPSTISPIDATHHHRTVVVGRLPVLLVDMTASFGERTLGATAALSPRQSNEAHDNQEASKSQRSTTDR